MAAALYRGQGTTAAAIRPTTIKLDQEQQPNIHGRHSIRLTEEPCSVGYADYKCVYVDLNTEKSSKNG